MIANRLINSSCRGLNSIASKSLLNNTTRYVTVQQQIRTMSWKKFINPFQYYKDNADTQPKRRVQKELDQGVLWDVKEFMNNPTMKIFVGSPNLISESQADIVPKVKSKDLDGNQLIFPDCLNKDKKPSLLIVSVKPYHADKFINSWSEPFKKEFPQLNIHSLFLISQLGYQILSPLLKSTRKGKNNDVIESWSNQPIAIKKSNTIYEDFNVTNPFSSYIYLVVDGKIRWKSSGLSTPNEIETLTKLTKSLLEVKK
ncbi:hypothetical protein RB653_010644 [Dictyostelium firmibasis]|uniref:Uncharacterized protein n=1 Tax=Dictyostelium firmibasis TaxID=79012 RepID=A0AAN7TLY5_9MYCE